MLKNEVLSEKAKVFVKKNKKLIIEKFASLEKFPAKENPFSIFMAGSPGAGKTEFSKAIINSFSDAIRVDPDEIRNILPGYVGGNAFLFQGASSLGVEKIYDSVLKNKQNVILDGTMSNYSASLKNIQRSIRKNRKVGIFYIYQDPVLAWEFTKKREFLEGRNIPKDSFVESFFSAKDNVNKLKKIFDKEIKVFLVEKNFENGVKNIFADIENIDKYIKFRYSLKTLKKKLC